MRNHSRGNAAHGRSTRRGRTGDGAKVTGWPSLGFSHGCGTRCGGPPERSRVAAAFASSPLDDDRGEDGERRPGGEREKVTELEEESVYVDDCRLQKSSRPGTARVTYCRLSWHREGN